MISQLLISNIKSSVSSLFEELSIPHVEDLNVVIEQPAHSEHGDYSTNIAMQLAKVLRKPPVRIAEMLKEHLIREGNSTPIVSKIEVAPPGFINLFIDWTQWSKKEFSLPPSSREKVIVEHTSINPNKSAHIGHLRNSCIGDTLVRL